jgi:Fe-S-cluster containining protein
MQTVVSVLYSHYLARGFSANMEVEKIIEKAKQARNENKRFLQRLKKQKPKDLDHVAQSAHDEVFETVDCLECANCCKTTSPIFHSKDIDRMAKHFRVRPTAFIDQYLHVDEDSDYVLNSAPCPFLGADNYCSVYEARPNACREYPHTDRKRFHQLLDLTYRNTMVCPAVVQIVQKLKEHY